MINRLKRQIFGIVVLGIGIPLFIIILGSNIIFDRYTVRQNYTLLEQHANLNNEKGKEGIGLGKNHGNDNGNFYYAKEKNGIWSCLSKSEHGFDNYNEEDLNKIAENLYERAASEEYGRVRDILYAINSDNKEKIVVFLDIHDFYEKMLFLGAVSIVGYIVIMALLVIVGIFISKRVSRPVEESFEKQKCFISDASHELKTPLAVIKSNEEILESEVGENKWLGYISSEVDRMSNLIENLLTLTRVDSEEKGSNFNKFNISDALISIALPFESIAYDEQVEYHVNIPDGYFYNGNENEIKQLVVILLDNAMKHTNDNGDVVIDLTKMTSGKIEYIIEVKNTGEPIPKEEQSKIFERFYRVDKSRSRSEGRYGLGLAIASTIVEKHNGKINVSCENGWNCFTVSL